MLMYALFLLACSASQGVDTLYVFMLVDAVASELRFAVIHLWLFYVSVIACCQPVTRNHCHATGMRVMQLWFKMKCFDGVNANKFSTYIDEYPRAYLQVDAQTWACS